ncbi:MAG: glycogen debranching protein GlgX [Janthinobacterium lividum]
MSIATDRLQTGLPYPMGASWDGLGINFAVFSANATRIELCLFDRAGRKEIGRYDLPECTDEVWHGYLPGGTPGMLYGYRAHGPYAPQDGHRFNPNKLLLDPYARQLHGPLRWSDALFGYRLNSNREDLSFDRRDSAPAMPKCIVVDDALDMARDRPPARSWSETVIYEAHPRGISMLRDEVRPQQRGTFAALANPRFIEHLHHIGVTAVELLPVHAILRDRFLVERGLFNYWGYNTLSFFAPEPSYFASVPHAAGALNEMRMAIRQLHAAGIEVILDVVFNHTCEGNELGPTVSWRGLDNASYYRLVPGDQRHHLNYTGCGNTVNLSHPRVLQMVMDSLRYWAKSFHIDGFRFDLGVTLGREDYGFDPGSSFFDAIRQDPLLAGLKMISEPWDLGADGYQVGRHPPGFAEWNDKFRDGMRRMWRGDAGQRGDIAARLTGSADLFNHRRRRTWASVNFVASHDGFTLADTVAYNDKHNEANGEGSADGHNENCSSNWGVEGPTDDPAILALRERVARALIAMPFISLGTPMLLAGDEFGRTQQGNNNAYCQDNELSWVDWPAADEPAARRLTDFVARLAQLRRDYPLLRQTDFLYGVEELIAGVHDADWFDERGEVLTWQAWRDPEGRALACRRAGRGAAGQLQVLLLLINASAVDLQFVPPSPVFDWTLLIDTAQVERRDAPVPLTGCAVAAHSLQILAATVPEAVAPRAPDVGLGMGVEAGLEAGLEGGVGVSSDASDEDPPAGD